MPEAKLAGVLAYPGPRLPNSYQVTLTWPPYPHQGTITHLLVHRNGLLIATLPGNATSFIDNGTTVAGPVNPLTHYDYDVTVNFNNGCPTRLSLAPVDVGCYAQDATHVDALDNGDGTAAVTWDLPTTGAPFFGYTVAWGTVMGGPYPNHVVIANPNAVSTTLATGDGLFYIVVKGVDAANCASAGNNEVNVTVSG